MPKFRDAINRLPVIRTLHKIYAIYSSNLKIEAKLKDLEFNRALQRAADYERRALMRAYSGVLEEKRAQKLIVSLTSYGERINSVHVAIESLMLQTLKADEIVLWLSETEFDHESLPEILKLHEQWGLTIAFTKDIGSYKKLIPALKAYPNDLIITVDDDFIYPVNHLEKLYKAWVKEPGYIHCHRAHWMKFDNQGSLLSYNEWDFETAKQQPSTRVFPTAGAGALYFPGCFSPEVSSEDIFLDICPSADDIWFKVMSLLKGVRCKVVDASPAFSTLTSIAGIGPGCLWDINIEKNDSQLVKVMSFYSEQLKDLNS